MQERIQLALILLLFALAGSLEDTSFRSGAESVRPALTQSSVAGSHAAACNYFSAAICPCAVSIEAPAAPSDHKAAVRQLAGASPVMPLSASVPQCGPIPRLCTPTPWITTSSLWGAF